MAITKLNPYLLFNGTADAAIRLYEHALGARTERVQRFNETPGTPCGSDDANRVMHAFLRLGAGTLMISDAPADRPVELGANAQVCLEFDDAEEMAAKFEALAVGGTVSMPLQDTFWGAKFGMLTDAQGIRWMFNHTIPQRD